MASTLPPQMESIEKEVRDIFKILNTSFNRLDQTEDEGRQTKQMEGLTARMRDARRLIKDFDKELKEEEDKMNPESHKLLNERKQSLIKELNTFVALRRTYTSSLGSRQEFLGSGSLTGSLREQSNQEHIPDRGGNEQTDQAMKSNKDDAGPSVTVDVPPETAPKPDNEADTAQPSIKKELRKRCIYVILLLIIVGLLVVIMLKVVPMDKKVPVTAPAPTQTRRLLLTTSEFQ